MAKVTSYKVLFYGSPDGYASMRAQIELAGANGNLGWIHFTDSGMPFENDFESGGYIHMHLPSEMFESVFSVLRDEKATYFYYLQNRAFLGTMEPGPAKQFDGSSGYRTDEGHRTETVEASKLATKQIG